MVWSRYAATSTPPLLAFQPGSEVSGSDRMSCERVTVAPAVGM
jgi:hypothetical protein